MAFIISFNIAMYSINHYRLHFFLIFAHQFVQLCLSHVSVYFEYNLPHSPSLRIFIKIICFVIVVRLTDSLIAIQVISFTLDDLITRNERPFRFNLTVKNNLLTNSMTLYQRCGFNCLGCEIV